MRPIVACFLLVGLAACFASEKAKTYGDPTALSTPTEESGITAWIISPTLAGGVLSATPEIVIGAYAYEGQGETRKPKPLRVTVGRIEKGERGDDELEALGLAVSEGEPGPEQRFRVTMPLVHGYNRVLVRIETEDRSRVRRLSFALEYRGRAPGVSVSVRVPTPDAEREGDVCGDTRALEAGVTNARMVCVRGLITTLDGAEASAQLRLRGGASKRVALDHEGRFATALALPENRQHVIELFAEDEHGQSSTAETRVVQDEEPPKLEVKTLARETAADTLELEGTASDPYGIDALEIHDQAGGVHEIGAGSPWKAVVRLAYGDNQIEVVARDLAGNESRTPLTLFRQRTLWLGAPRKEAGATHIEVGRLDLAELLSEEDQKELEMASIALGPSVKNALERIREPERFGVDTSAWGAAEWNLQRILTMTPDTADLSGTSMEELLNIAEAIGLPSPRVLAEILDLEVTEPFIDPDVAADVLMDLLVGTHPNVSRDEDGEYVINVSLYDVFQDMRTIAPRFGPAGEHPGFLEGESYSAVLEPGFLLTLPVTSNLVQYDAVDLSRRTKDFLFLLEGERVLDFNVLTDEFVVVGLAHEPTIDLRFSLLEHPGPNALVAGSGREENPDLAAPGFYRGNGQGFAVAPWLFEHITVESGYRMYHDAFAQDDYKRVLRYDTGSVTNAAIISWDRGWVSIQTAGGIGAPPPPLYAWDLLMEVAQVRLHDSGLAEGEANMAFALEGLPIGVTADELIEKLRPKLAEQETKLSELFVGELGLATSYADIYYVPAKGDDGALLFRAKSDSETPYTYPKPGFYSDPALSRKVSTLEERGGVRDTAHEKVAAKLGSWFYVCDEVGDVFRLEIAERDRERVGLRVTKVEVVK